MDWSFVFMVLRAYGFPELFISWISVIFHSAKLSILINGRLHGYFSCTRGVRQGDPLSPILFGVAEDVLSRMLIKAVIDRQLEVMVYTTQRKFPSHFLYADDILLFSKATVANADIIKRIFDSYGKLSGQICNAEKSHIYFGDGVTTDLKRNINRRLHFRFGSFPFNYLGAPLFMGRPTAAHFIPVRDKILNRFHKWYGLNLSMAGRMCLVQYVIQSSTIHSMLVYRWPAKIIREIDKACRNFIWTGSITTKPFRPVAWDVVCSPKACGGLGIHSFCHMNDSLLAKVAWKTIRGTDFGYDMLQARYLDECRQPRQVRYMSSVWMGVRRGISELHDETFCSIGEGSTVSFWWDNWLGYRLSDRLHIPTFLRPFLGQRCSDFFFDGMWHFTEDFVVHHTQVVIDILLLPLGDREDIRYWQPSLSGDISAKLVYQRHSRNRINTKWGRWLWTPSLPVRRSLICWRAIRGRLPTYDALMRCGFAGPNVCHLCCRDMESIDHIFWNCNLAQAAWQRLFRWFGVELPLCVDFNSFFVYVMDREFSPQFAGLWKIGVITMVWALWNDRNAAIYEDMVASPFRILAFVKAAILESQSSFSMGYCFNTWTDYTRGRALGVPRQFAPPRQFISVSWWPPIADWMKVNTDGSASGSPGTTAAGGVFRDAYGAVRGCFHINGGTGFAYEAELLAAVTAIQLAKEHGWCKLWLETDSTYVSHLLENRSVAVPWHFANRWRKAMAMVEMMEFQVSHIYREGNQVADLMANPSTPSGWWPYCIPLIANAVSRDIFVPRFHREV